MEYTTKSGYTLTEDMIDDLAEAAARGDYPGEPGRIVVAPQGRPKLCDEELVTVAFKIPRSVRDRLDKKAAQNSETRSQFLRDTLERVLA